MKLKLSPDLRRYALSTLVNTLLESEKPIPLEFKINGTFLRTSLEEYLTANGISAENTLTVDYVRAIIPPLYLASFEHDAWVSSVDILSLTSDAGKWSSGVGLMPGHERILSADFDGILRVWNMSSAVLATSSGSNASTIKSAKFLSPSQVVSSGYDSVVRLWRYSEDKETSSASLTPELDLIGHRNSVESIAVHQPSNRILSASADRSVLLWSTKESEGPQAPVAKPRANAPSNKRPKISNPDSTAQRGPLSVLDSHSDSVSAAIFAPNDSTVAYSSSWDHTVKTWDLATSQVVDTRTTSASIDSLIALPTKGYLAAGSTDNYIAIIDPRASATNISVMTLRGHSNSVRALAPDPDNEFGLVSGSHDGTCRVWDIRSTSSDNKGRVGKSIYTIARESVKGEKELRVGGVGVKVFDVKWDSKIGIVSASEDKTVQINQGKGVPSSDTAK